MATLNQAVYEKIRKGEKLTDTDLLNIAKDHVNNEQESRCDFYPFTDDEKARIVDLKNKKITAAENAYISQLDPIRAIMADEFSDEYLEIIGPVWERMKD